MTANASPPTAPLDDEAGETEAVHLGEKDQYPEDSSRAIGYIYLEWIANFSVDPWARRAARQVQAALGLKDVAL